MNAYADETCMETRFVWARCSPKDARTMRELIKSFQMDGWSTPPAQSGRKSTSRRSCAR
jgi:MarR-like DNA-binding transcriptional regulator SgrR of sgrS sRNA